MISNPSLAAPASPHRLAPASTSAFFHRAEGCRAGPAASVNAPPPRPSGWAEVAAGSPTRSSATDEPRYVPAQHRRRPPSAPLARSLSLPARGDGRAASAARAAWPGGPNAAHARAPFAPTPPAPLLRSRTEPALPTAPFPFAAAYGEEALRAELAELRHHNRTLTFQLLTQGALNLALQQEAAAGRAEVRQAQLACAQAIREATAAKEAAQRMAAEGPRGLNWRLSDSLPARYAHVWAVAPRVHLRQAGCALRARAPAQAGKYLWYAFAAGLLLALDALCVFAAFTQRTSVLPLLSFAGGTVLRPR